MVHWIQDVTLSQNDNPKLQNFEECTEASADVALQQMYTTASASRRKQRACLLTYHLRQTLAVPIINTNFQGMSNALYYYFNEKGCYNNMKFYQVFKRESWVYSYCNSLGLTA